MHPKPLDQQALAAVYGQVFAAALREEGLIPEAEAKKAVLAFTKLLDETDTVSFFHARLAGRSE